MALVENERKAVWRQWMREWSKTHRSIALTKADLRAAVDAVDNWIDANQASYNNALPANVRSELTTEEKAELLMYVVDRRFEVS